MIFYVVELSLKAYVLQSQLLIGPLGRVWWNWLDLLIVVAGVCEMYVMPALEATGVVSEGHGGAPFLNFLRGLRLVRLARILKLFMALWKSDLEWADGHTFNTFMMGIILLNSVVIGIETEIPHWAGWFFVEQIFLIVFVFELTVRLKRWHLTFFCHPTDTFWNWLDFSIVAGGVFEQWLLPLITIISAMLHLNTTSTMPHGTMALIRLARLLRVMRLVRVVKSVPPLYDLVRGMSQAMQGIAWVIILTILVLYIFALLAVKLIGEGLLIGKDSPEEVTAPFSSLGEAAFVLFKVMNGDQSVLEALFHDVPLMKVVFVVFIIITNWSILAIVTAVVSENMITVTEENQMERDAEEKLLKEERAVARLEEIFASLDKDGSGDLDLAEFSNLLNDKSSTARDELCEAAGMDTQDLLDIFNTLSSEPEDSREVPKVKRWMIIDGLRHESSPPTERSIMRLEKKLNRIEQTLTAQPGNQSPGVPGSVRNLAVQSGSW
jgi:voltage-gated sodium channel